MGLFSFLFPSKYPRTSKYEAEIKRHEADFVKYNEFANDAALLRYNELKVAVGQEEFKQKVNKLKTERFEGTEQQRRLAEFKSLEKSAELKMYFKFVESGLDRKVKSALTSDVYSRYQELKQRIEQPQFMALKKQKDFKKTEEYVLLKEFDRIRKAAEVKTVAKYKDSKEYKNYLAIDNSEKLARFNELKTYVNTPEFKAFKAEMEDKKRFQKSVECAILKEFDQLSKNKQIIWFNKCTEVDAFADIKKWTLTFEDDFAFFDDKKWGYGAYYSTKAVNDLVSQEGQKQAYKRANVECLNNKLVLSVRKEDAEGVVWAPMRGGFVKEQMNYTAGMINSAESFRQQYGKFVFKVKADFVKDVMHSIYLQGEKIAPIICPVVYGLDKKKGRASVVTGVDANAKAVYDIEDLKLYDDFYIVELEWSADKIVWSINGKEVYTYKGVVPAEPMYVVLSNVLYNDVKKLKVSQMIVDYIKVYKQNV